MAGRGPGRTPDLINQISNSVIKLFRRNEPICTAPCDGWILKMHYQWTFWVFITTFSSIMYSWFHSDVIVCASQFNAGESVRTDYLNVCLSYPYLLNTDGTKRYLMFYRWVHWICLLMAAVYYIPHKMSKSYDNPKVKKLFEDLASTLNRYDNVETQNVQVTTRYFAFNKETHNRLYIKYYLCNFVAFFIDLAAFFFLNFVFQGRFLSYGVNAWPFNRDPMTFNDTMSQTFPPFAQCSLHKNVKLVDERREEFGCHLTVMELYEKIFLFLWFWLVTLMVLTFMYICYLTAFKISAVKRLILKISKPVTAVKSSRHTVCSAIEVCKIGDIFLLYRLRQFFTHAKFYDLLTLVADQEHLNKMLELNIVIEDKRQNTQMPLNHPKQNVRRRN